MSNEVTTIKKYFLLRTIQSATADLLGSLGGPPTLLFKRVA